jgi:hypothetical protein
MSAKFSQDLIIRTCTRSCKDLLVRISSGSSKHRGPLQDLGQNLHKKPAFFPELHLALLEEASREGFVVTSFPRALFGGSLAQNGHSKSCMTMNHTMIFPIELYRH